MTRSLLEHAGVSARVLPCVEGMADSHRAHRMHGNSNMLT